MQADVLILCSIHSAGRSRFNETAIIGHSIIEPEAAGEVIAVKAVSGQDTTGNVAAQTALTDDVDRLNNLSSSNLNQNHLSRESEAPTTYGRYENVFLTESEYAELLRDFPDRLDRLISELSSYMESTGRSYQNHAATIRRWAENDKTKGVPKQGIPDYTCKEGESL